uniref:Uncharacterized protein n=1 Tax=Acrobeloides nanus TaxID=290746 RepID=A0A914DR14_9BILA
MYSSDEDEIYISGDEGSVIDVQREAKCANHVCEEHFHILCDNCLNIEDSVQENDKNQEVEDEDMEEETSSE